MKPQELHINDIFHTVQGEGLHAGRRALFVRMPFCNLACAWCDTTFDSFKRYTLDDLAHIVAREPSTNFAVLTGGEPMMHKHSPKVVRFLKDVGFEVATETNGNFPIVKGVDFVTCSPKRDARPVPYGVHQDAWPLVSEFKYVVDKDFDFDLLLRHDTTDGRRYSLSPEYGQMQESVERILKYMSRNPDWRLNLQTHKWIDIK